MQGERPTALERMGKRNLWDGRCSECGAQVRAQEGLVEDASPSWGYGILCPECMPVGILDPPKPPEASKLPNIHTGDDRYER